MVKTVTVIPQRKKLYSVSVEQKQQRRRVAAYARVSTDSEEQLTSYEAQVDYYTKFIQKNENWEFVKVYTDEGISATNIKHRDGFNEMVKDALAGKIDLIITKSVSRFARNTVDSLVTVRELKAHNVEVYFEKENIYTFDGKGELLITIMSSLAQEESRSISENVTWGQRKRFADGKLIMSFGNFLGYKRGENGQPEIVEKEAKIVRLIYKMFLEGKTPTYIAKYLTEQNIPTPRDKNIWRSTTVESILKNEKYKGAALLQKTFTTDFLTKKKKINEGEIPQYYVEDSHPAIVSKEVYSLVQQEFEKRKNSKNYMTTSSCFSGKIFCGNCGGLYGSKVWHSNSKYRRTIWQCNNKFKNADKCKTPNLTETELKSAFVKVFNEIIDNREEIIGFIEKTILELHDMTELEKGILTAKAETKTKLEAVNEYVKLNSRTAIPQEEYSEYFDKLMTEYEMAQGKLHRLEKEKNDIYARNERCKQFIQTLKQSDILQNFDEELFNSTVEKISVYTDRMVFEFKDGRKRSIYYKERSAHSIIKGGVICNGKNSNRYTTA